MAALDTGERDVGFEPLTRLPGLSNASRVGQTLKKRAAMSGAACFLLLLLGSLSAAERDGRQLARYDSSLAMLMAACWPAGLAREVRWRE